MLLSETQSRIRRNRLTSILLAASVSERMATTRARSQPQTQVKNLPGSNPLQRHQGTVEVNRALQRRIEGWRHPLRRVR